jgi:hypothetical protein
MIAQNVPASHPYASIAVPASQGVYVAARKELNNNQGFIIKTR